MASGIKGNHGINRVKFGGSARPVAMFVGKMFCLGMISHYAVVAIIDTSRRVEACVLLLGGCDHEAFPARGGRGVDRWPSG